jgi:hypothetical protein
MVRNSLVHALVLSMVWTIAGGIAVAADKVRDDVASQVSTLSLGQLILRDTFNDNKIASMWRKWADDVNNCWVTEVNGHLEVQAKTEAADVFSGYVAHAWRLDPADDFTMKVEFHIDTLDYPRSWVSLGITPDGDKPRNRRISMDAQCVNRCKSYRYECKDGLSVDASVTERLADDGVLYVSYTASTDTLYLSMTGYGEDNAWGVFEGILRGQWAGRPLYVYAGGGSDGMAISSGHVYLDNLEVETGTVVEASLSPVYHFKAVSSENHFYTMSHTEKEDLLTNTGAWTYVGIAFYAFPDDSDPDCKPVYRFYSKKTHSHFYTMSEDEKNGLLGVWGWIYEGIAFYAYPVGSHPDWACPVYRFWSNKYGAHLYTTDEAEKNNMINKLSDVWTYENIGWYAIR